MKELKARYLKNWLETSRGLIGKNRGEAIFFKTRWGVHTFFVRFPIDVIILDQQNRICLLKKKLLPNRIFVWNPKYFRVIELPFGTIEKLNLKKGEKINITFV